MKLSQLHPNNGQIEGVPTNPRYISKEDFGKLKKSITSFVKMMALRPIVVDEGMNILGGNMRYQALCKLAEEGAVAPILGKDGEVAEYYKFDGEIPDEWVAIAKNLTPEEKREFVIKDNVEQGQWDFDALANEWDEVLLDEWGVKWGNTQGVDVDGEESEDEIIERKKKEFEEKMANGELDEDDPEYQEFLQKFEAKKTTDDCYTPEVIYDAVADWVANEYKVSRADFVRPFYPGGDYQKEKYKKSDIVVDNPPFSILAEILDYYNKNGIKYFLFAPALTICGTASDRCTWLGIGVAVTYANGANVSTSFLTNLEDADIVCRAVPSLYKAVKEANDKNLENLKKNIPKYAYPDNLITASFIGYLSKYGQGICIKRNESVKVARLDAQESEGKAIFGSGYLVSDAVAEARKRAEEEARKRPWELSDREREIINQLNKKNNNV